MKALILLVAIALVTGCAQVANRNAPSYDETRAKAVRQEALDYCSALFASSALDPLRSKTTNDTIPLAMLVDNTRATESERAALLAQSEASKKCMERRLSDEIALGMPQEITPVIRGFYMQADLNRVRLYRGEITWGEYNQAKNANRANFGKTYSEFVSLWNQRNAEAQHRARMLALEQQRTMNDTMHTYARMLAPTNIRCTSQQMGTMTFTDCR